MRISFVCFLLVVAQGVIDAQTVVSANQGFSMRIQLNNQGVFGRYAYPGGPPPVFSGGLGLEYPVGQPIEHLLGAGIWVGGKLDTARTGTSPQLRLVSTAYEGWSGPLFEFYPGSSPADSIWRVIGRGVARPPSWESYWGNLIPRTSVSDNDMYMIYTDYQRMVTGHIPLGLKVAQSSYVWSDSSAEGIQVVEYKLINTGMKTIDSVYIGLFSEMDVGYLQQASYWLSNYSGYFSSSRTAYAHNPLVFGTTPVGISMLAAPRPFDSLRVAFRWFPGPQTPAPDAAKYALLSSGIIQPDEYPALSDTRFVLSCGPFTINPITHASPDTLVLAFALVAGQTPNQVNTRALRARQIYTSTVQSGISSQPDFNRKTTLSTGDARK